MKKNKLNLFFCGLFCSLFTNISAQQAITHSSFPQSINKTIVKEYVYPSVVCYLETKNMNYFAYSDASMNIKYHEIGADVFVQDFKILDDTVYFCGYSNKNGCDGVWGYFRVTDLNNSMLFYNTYSGFNCNNKHVDTLHSVIAYNDKGKKHIVAVGTATGGSSSKKGCTIDITPSSSGGTYAWDYTIGVTPDNSGEIIKYVCETDNLVVTAGSYSNAPKVESYRRHLKNNLFAIGGLQDTVWCFPASTWQPYNRDASKFAITHKSGDVVATALNAFKLDNQTNYIMYYEHDMSNLVSGVVGTINSLAVSTGQYPLEVQGIVYSTINNTFSLLVNGTSPLPPLYGYASIVADIIPGSISANLHIAKGLELHSIDNYHFQQNFVCAGTDMLATPILSLYTQPVNYNFNCVINTYIQGIKPVFAPKCDKRPFTVCHDSFNSVEYKSPLLVTPNIIFCQ